MGRFYLAVALVFAAAAARAQTPAPPPAEQPLLGSTFDVDLLRAFPISNNPLAILETVQLETIANRVSTGGLDIAPQQVGGLLNSWTQTQFQIGDIPITDPRTGGTPLLAPPQPIWQRATIATGAVAADAAAAAVSMRLDPVRPGAAWTGDVEGSLSGAAFVAGVTGSVAPVDRVDRWQHGDAMFAGPLSDRSGLAAGVSYRGFAHVPVGSTAPVDDHLATAFAHLVVAAGPAAEVRAFGMAQHVAAGGASDSAVHLQSTWDSHGAARPWRIFGGYTERTRTATLPSTLVLDTLTSDPVDVAIDPGNGSTRRWALGARVGAAAASRIPSLGVDVEGARVRADATGVNEVRELVNGLPARLWKVASAAATDRRHFSSVAAYANEHLAVERLTIDAGLRLEVLDAAADAAASGIRWTTWLPRAAVRWSVVDVAHLTAIGAYRRSAYQLPLNVLAIGDPAAPIADVFAWNGQAIGAAIARVGPGSGGDPTFARIDQGLQRPTTDELVLAVSARPRPGLELQLARITKREQPLLQLVDTGVPSSAYAPVIVADPSFEPGSPVGAPTVTAYNRPAGTFALDRYVLTNRSDQEANSWALELVVRATTGRLTLIGGAALTEAHGPAAAVGFLPTENDQDVVGTVFVDRNRETNARGQLFQDRSHVMKIAAVYRLPWRIDVGAVLRYQDGQPFTRVVVAPNLTQGPVLVRSYANGGSAFTYTGTLDVRAQKRFTSGRATVSAIVDVYNAPNLGNEVTEYVVTGAAFRTPTALQPPLTVVAGLRVAF